MSSFGAKKRSGMASKLDTRVARDCIDPRRDCVDSRRDSTSSRESKESKTALFLVREIQRLKVNG